MINENCTVHTGNPEKCRTLADSLAKLISSQKTIAYVKFLRQVAPLTKALRECGTEDDSYHGKTSSLMTRTCSLVGGAVLE